MHIGQIMRADVGNGPGIRVTVFVSGCTNHCKGCFQPQTWDFNYGKEWTKESESLVLNELSKNYVRGLTLLGGEPFEPENQRELVKLLRKVKEQCPSKDVWCFTGFLYENLVRKDYIKHCEVTDEILSMIDVLVDGPFVLEQKDLTLVFRGSRNQRIIDMNKTRAKNTICVIGDPSIL